MSTGEAAGWLHKLGGGQLNGNAWNRRYFCLYGDVLSYAREANALPTGVVQLASCEVSERGEMAAQDGSLRFEFGLAHPCGDTLVLAAPSADERASWVKKLRAASALHSQVVAAKGASKSDAEERSKVERTASLDGECNTLKAALAEAETTLAGAEAEQHRADGELQEARSALALRSALLHWRTRTLRGCFFALRASARGHRSGAETAAAEYEELELQIP